MTAGRSKVLANVAMYVMCHGAMGAVWPIAAQVTQVELEAEDGLRLRGTLYAGQRTAPGVLLHHMCGDWRADYHPLARAMMEEGFTVLTYDLRGEGETGGPRPFQDGRATAEDLDRFFASDAEVALGYLLRQPNVDSERIVVGGASCGTFPAVRITLEHEVVRGLILLSGIPHTLDLLMQERPQVRLFGVSARDDRAAQLPMYEHVQGLQREGDVVRIYDQGGHGTRNLTTHPELIEDVIEWMRTIAEERIVR